jgi:hypothetical protein
MSEDVGQPEVVSRNRRRTWFGMNRKVASGCLIAVCLLLASGRMASLDGSSQLAQAVHFCDTGNIGAKNRIDHDFAPKDFRLSTGVWYDSNDIGATLLTLPAACLSVAFGAQNPVSLGELTTVAKAGASLTFALAGGIAVMFVFLSLTELIDDSARAWWWSLVFLFGTGFLAYVKGVWNVLPAATFIAVLAWVAIRALKHRISPTRAVYLAAAAVAAASLFRYTLLPFLLAGAVVVLLPILKSVPRRHLAGAALLLFVLVLPSFAYNELRTGLFWRPGQSAPQFPANNVLHTGLSYWLGTTGMFFSFNRGLLFFAPICLLGYFGGLIYIVRSSGLRRRMWIGGLALVVGYIVSVCLLHGWAANLEWGPRYLVPVFPVLFLVGVISIERRLVPRALGYGLAALGLLTQLPTAIVNWAAVIAVVGKSSLAPDPIVGVWESAIKGVIHGKGLGTAVSSEALQVPDVWWWHAVASVAPSAIGSLVLLAALATLLWLANAPTRTPRHVALPGPPAGAPASAPPAGSPTGS